MEQNFRVHIFTMLKRVRPDIFHLHFFLIERPQQVGGGGIGGRLYGCGGVVHIRQLKTSFIYVHDNMLPVLTVHAYRLMCIQSSASDYQWIIPPRRDCNRGSDLRRGAVNLQEWPPRRILRQIRNWFWYFYPGTRVFIWRKTEGKISWHSPFN